MRFGVSDLTKRDFVQAAIRTLSSITLLQPTLESGIKAYTTAHDELNSRREQFKPEYLLKLEGELKAVTNDDFKKYLTEKQQPTLQEIKDKLDNLLNDYMTDFYFGGKDADKTVTQEELLVIKEELQYMDIEELIAFYAENMHKPLVMRLFDVNMRRLANIPGDTIHLRVKAEIEKLKPCDAFTELVKDFAHAIDAFIVAGGNSALITGFTVKNDTMTIDDVSINTVNEINETNYSGFKLRLNFRSIESILQQPTKLFMNN